MSETGLLAGAIVARPHPAAAAAQVAVPARARPAPAAGTETVLEIADISLAFGGVAALRHVSLALRAGEICAVIGPNGAGKSSLLNVISGLYAPDSGTITLAGRRAAQVVPSRLARLGVARTFQNLALFGGLSVADNIATGLSAHTRAGLLSQLLALPAARADRRHTQAAVQQALAYFHLLDHAGQPVVTLPYGIQKRVELARAMVAHPRVLLLDEPMAGIPSAEKQELAGYIRAIRDTYGTAVVLIEHDIGVVMSLADRIAVLDDGRKIAEGTPQAIAADPAVIDAYLGVAHDDAAEH